MSIISLRKIIGLSLFSLILATVLFGFAETSQAASIDLVSWSWSSSIGHVSFNSKNCDINQNGFMDTACGGNDSSTPINSFGVKLEDGTGFLSGQAWSSSIGWISFDVTDVAVCPLRAAEDLNNKQARVDLASGEVRGWARALSGDKNPFTGLQDPDNPYTGGWDGCIHLSSGTVAGGQNNTGVSDGTRGVTMRTTGNTKQFVGYAWGGEVVGWLNFSPFMTGTPPPPPPCCGNPPPVCVGVCGPGGNDPTVTLTANGSTNPPTVTSGSPVLLEWFPSADVTSCSTSMLAGTDPGGWASASKSIVNTTQNFNSIPDGSYIFNINCVNGSGSDSSSVTVNVGTGGTGTVTVSCRALNAPASNGGTVITEVLVGNPVFWEATIQLTGTPPGPASPYSFEWQNNIPGSGFATPLAGTSASPVITVQRTYSTIGTKQVKILITGTGAPNSTGLCVVEPGVLVRAMPTSGEQ